MTTKSKHTATATSTTDKYEIAARLTLAGFHGLKVRLSAAEQREIFGAYVLGKLDLHIDCRGQGSIYAVKRVIPNDFVFRTWTFEEVAEAVNTGKTLRIS